MLSFLGLCIVKNLAIWSESQYQVYDSACHSKVIHIRKHSCDTQVNQYFLTLVFIRELVVQQKMWHKIRKSLRNQRIQGFFIVTIVVEFSLSASPSRPCSSMHVSLLTRFHLTFTLVILSSDKNSKGGMATGWSWEIMWWCAGELVVCGVYIFFQCQCQYPPVIPASSHTKTCKFG